MPRAYLCIAPPSFIIESLCQVQDSLKSTEEFRQVEEPISWQRQDAFHITVLYIGTIAPATETIIRSYVNEFEFEPFEVVADTLDTFKTTTQHVLHLRITKGQRQLGFLHNTFERVLERAHALDPNRYVYQAYTPHITLARSPLVQPFPPLSNPPKLNLPLAWEASRVASIIKKDKT